MQFDLFKDFNKRNVVNWLTEILLLIKQPRKFVNQISSKTPEALFSQYLFYFILYTFSYLLSNNSIEFNHLLRPSLIDLFICIPILVLFAASCKLATGKSQTGKLATFIFSLYLLYAPGNVFLHTLYLVHENYFFLYLGSLWTLAFFTYLFYGFPFVIQSKLKTGFKILIANIFLITAGYLALEILAKKLQKPHIAMAGHDLIGEEYREFIGGVVYQRQIPGSITVLDGKTPIKTFYALMELNSNQSFQFHPDSIKSYQLAISNNISYIKNRLPKLRFHRNIQAAQKLLDYDERILKSITPAYFQNTGTPLDEALLNGQVAGRKLHNDLHFDTKLVAEQYSIKRYNNQIVKLNAVNEGLMMAQTLVVMISGKLASGALYPNREIIPEEPFLNFEP